MVAQHRIAARRSWIQISLQGLYALIVFFLLLLGDCYWTLAVSVCVHVFVCHVSLFDPWSDSTPPLAHCLLETVISQKTEGRVESLPTYVSRCVDPRKRAKMNLQIATN